MVQGATQMVNTHCRKSIFIKLSFYIGLLSCLSTDARADNNTIWEDMGLYGGQIPAIAVDPEDSSILYAGSWLGDGLFK